MRTNKTLVAFTVLISALCTVTTSGPAAAAVDRPVALDSGKADKDQPAKEPAERDSAEAAATAFIEGVKAKDAAALARVIADGEDGSAAERAEQTLKRKGSFRGIAGVIEKCEKIWTGKTEAGPADAKPPLARVQLLRKGKRGDDRSAGSLEVIKGKDGWRVNDWDMPH